MLKHIIRIENTALRVVLLFWVFPFYYWFFIMKAALPVAWGGIPDGTRLLELEFYTKPFGYFCEAIKGKYVPKGRIV